MLQKSLFKFYFYYFNLIVNFYEFHLIANNMQLSVGKHCIQLTIKYTHLKYIISIITYLFKSILTKRCHDFAWNVFVLVI